MSLRNHKTKSLFWRVASVIIVLALIATGAYFYLKPQKQPPPPPPPEPSPTSSVAVVSPEEEAEQAYEAGSRAFAEKDYRTAIAQYTRVIELTPQSTAAYVARGNAQLALVHYDQAMSDYSLAIARDPEYSSAYFSSGTAHWLLGQLPEAESAYRKAVELEPDDSLTYSRLATVLYEQNKAKEVENLYQHAYEFNSRREWALMGWLGEVLSQKRYGDVLAICQGLRQKGDHSPALSLYSGIAHVELKEYSAAIPELEEVVRADPDGIAFDAYERLAEAYRAVKNVSRCEYYQQEFSRRMGRDTIAGWCKEEVEEGDAP